MTQEHDCCEESAPMNSSNEDHQCEQIHCFSINAFNDSIVVPQPGPENSFDPDSISKPNNYELLEQVSTRVASVGDRGSPFFRKSPIYLIYQKLLIP